MEKKRMGFACLSIEQRRAIASLGGKSVPKEKRSFSRNTDLAHFAGIKGGQNVPAEKRSFSQNRALAARAGEKGGNAKKLALENSRQFNQPLDLDNENAGD